MKITDTGQSKDDLWAAMFLSAMLHGMTRYEFEVEYNRRLTIDGTVYFDTKTGKFIDCQEFETK